MFEVAETNEMKEDKNKYNLGIAHVVGVIAMFGFLVPNRIFFLL